MKKIGYVRYLNLNTDVLPIDEQLNKLSVAKCDEIITICEDEITINEIERLAPGDIMVIERLNVISKNTSNNIDFINKLIKRGIKLDILNLGTVESTRSPLYKLLDSFHTYEVECLKERLVGAKKKASMKAGFVDGRPKKYVNGELERVVALVKEGKTYAEVTEITGISASTISRAMKKDREKEVD